MPTGVPSGVFRPALPRDAQTVLEVYAIAARAVCARADTLPQVERWLQEMQKRLVPPELLAAEACANLWRLFAQVAQIPKEALRVEAGRAFCYDLDALSQRLQLAPLADWADIPDRVDAPDAAVWGQNGDALRPEPVTLQAVCARAREHLAHVSGGPGADAVATAQEAGRLLALLSHEARRDVFYQVVSDGKMNRSDVNMLIRYLVKGADVSAADLALLEALQRLARWFADPERSRALPDPSLA